METDPPSPIEGPAFQVTTASSGGIPFPLPFLPSPAMQAQSPTQYSLVKQPLPQSQSQGFGAGSTSTSSIGSSSQSIAPSLNHVRSLGHDGSYVPLFPNIPTSESSSSHAHTQSAPGPISFAHLPRLEDLLGQGQGQGSTSVNLRSINKGKGKYRASIIPERQDLRTLSHLDVDVDDANMDYDQDPPVPHSAGLTLSLSLSSPPSSASLMNPNTSLQTQQAGKQQLQGVMSPPTPAPSPVPGRGRDGWWIPSGSSGDGMDEVDGKGWMGGEGLMDRDMAVALLASAGEMGCDPTSLLLAFPSLPPPTRLAFLNALLPMLTTPELLMLSSHIGPRLKRDFLRDLPNELALHCLSYVDDPRTLARAACVSRHWRKLLEDEHTWKDMCERHRFQTNPGPTLPSHSQGTSMSIPPPGFSSGMVTLSRAGHNGSDQIIIPSSTNQLPPAFGITNPEMFVPSRVRRDSGLMETDEDAALGQGLFQGGPIVPPTDPPAPHLVPNGGVTSAAAQAALSGLTAAQIANPAAMAGFAQMAIGTITSSNTANSIHMTGLTNGQLPPLPSVVSPGAQALSASISANRIRGNSLLGAGRAFIPEPTSFVGRQRVGSASVAKKLVVVREPGFSYKMHFKKSYLTESNWLRGGRLLSSHTSADDGVVTSLAVDSQHIIIGMANSKIHIFEAGNGTFLRTLSGHELGVWCLTLISAGGGSFPDEDSLSISSEDEDEMQAGPSFNIGSFDSSGRNSKNAKFSRNAKSLRKRNRSGQIRRPSLDAEFDGTTGFQRGSVANNATDRLPSLASVLENATNANGPTPPGSKARRMRQSDVCGAARGWGQKNSVVVSGGCDRDVKVWDLETGECLHTLNGHTSTIRCLKVIDGRPIVVSGSRDATLKVWDVEKGVLVHSLVGHQHSVRCIEIAGNQVVSGSYDCTCRIWDLDTGECLQTLRGHYHQIYAVAFDGERVATGSLDSTVRIWSAATGECVALLQGHTSLVGQLQLTGDTLITGGSDGRVIIFDLVNYTCLQRICAHDNSVTCLQFDDRFIVSGGNDGRVKLWDIRTGNFIRELSKPCEAVWRVTFRDDKCAILCKRNGKTVLEVLSFVPEEI